MKIMTVLGTRPEIIRLSIVIKKLDKYCNHVLVHTGQNYEYSLNKLFFKELKVRKPNYFLGVQEESFGHQVGKILVKFEKILLKEKPDALLILGDTNSGLVSIIAKRNAIPVYHMEAGNRCFDDRVPEEINRRIIDHSSSILMPYTNRSKENLIREGIERQRIFVIGNPIYEVIKEYEDQINKSRILETLGISQNKFFLLTMHRAENVDISERLLSIIKGLELLYKHYNYPIVCSLHPRTRNKLDRFNISIKKSGMKFLEPFGFFDFVALEKNVFCVITDSGTVQEECCIFKVPNITIRDVTERPETTECGSNILVGINPKKIQEGVKIATTLNSDWEPPVEYIKRNVSDTVLKIVLGYNYQK
jgi:UDP-N-acetylglucosamine 2-epimerase (non-hydrolysing)